MPLLHRRQASDAPGAAGAASGSSICASDSSAPRRSDRAVASARCSRCSFPGSVTPGPRTPRAGCSTSWSSRSGSAYYTTLKVEPNARALDDPRRAGADLGDRRARRRPRAGRGASALPGGVPGAPGLHALRDPHPRRAFSRLARADHAPLPAAGEHRARLPPPVREGLPPRARGRADRDLRPQALRRRRPPRRGARLLPRGGAGAAGLSGEDRRGRRRPVGTLGGAGAADHGLSR